MEYQLVTYKSSVICTIMMVSIWYLIGNLLVTRWILFSACNIINKLTMITYQWLRYGSVRVAFWLRWVVLF